MARSPLGLFRYNLGALRRENQTEMHVKVIAILASLQERSRKMLEVRTGEGKTLIVGITAAALAVMTKKPVDVLSSSPVLAQEGVDKNMSLFSLLGLSTLYACFRSAILLNVSQRARLSVWVGRRSANNQITATRPTLFTALVTTWKRTYCVEKDVMISAPKVLQLWTRFCFVFASPKH